MRIFEEAALVVAFVLTAATFFFSGPLAGVICLFFALCLIVVFWTPARGWLGIPPRDGEASSVGDGSGGAAAGAEAAVPLELWLQARVEAAETIANQRALRGGEWYFGEMNKWDFANVQRMHDGDDPLAPDLVEAYRSNPKTGHADGIYAPHDAAELDRYYEQRLRWLRKTLGNLRADSSSTSLADKIDALMREGIALVDELSASVEPERKPNGVWEVSGGGAPAEWQEKADGFRMRAWELLSQGRPALLVDYRDACNDFLQKQRDAQAPRSDQDLAQDKRSTAGKVLDFATAERSGPAMEVKACLEGLSAARHRLG